MGVIEMKIGNYIVVGAFAYLGLMLLRKKPMSNEGDAGLPQASTTDYTQSNITYEKFNASNNTYYACEQLTNSAGNSLYRVVKKVGGIYEPMMGVSSDRNNMMRNAYTYATKEECYAEVDRLANETDGYRLDRPDSSGIRPTSPLNYAQPSFDISTTNSYASVNNGGRGVSF